MAIFTKKFTIHHGFFLLEKNRHPGRRQGHEKAPTAGAMQIEWRSMQSLIYYNYIIINIIFILINPSCPRVLVSQHKQQSTIIWLGITRLGLAWLGGTTAPRRQGRARARQGTVRRLHDGEGWRGATAMGCGDGSSKAREGASAARDGATATRWRETARRLCAGKVICHRFER